MPEINAKLSSKIVEGHAMIAAALLPRVLASIDRQRGAHMSKLEAIAKPAPSIQQAP